MTTYFVRTRHPYGSYEDWYTLAALSGYPICYADEIDVLSDNTYIVNHFGALGLPGNEHKATARIILWQLEWETKSNYTQYPDNVCEVWASDAWYAQMVGARYVPMGSHPGLALRPFERAIQYDVALMMYREPYRRAKLIPELYQCGLTIAPDGWDEQRHISLMQSACLVHIHQHENWPTVAPLRYALAATYKLPLITETPKSRGIYGHTHMLNSDYDHLPEFVRLWVQRNGTSNLEDYGRALHQLLCVEQPFRVHVEAALA